MTGWWAVLLEWNSSQLGEAVSHGSAAVLHLSVVPTTRPRYTLTDTGHLADLLDAAERRWPEVSDRRQLLVRLAEEGHQALTRSEQQVDSLERDRRQSEALARIPALVDGELLLADQAWE